ncbi:Hypothetical predicted protein [Olea europaea subsp. europaea]|uniref:Uncharacterized protein n=1 Tax=Olea europaea subsp. europaea TaxID=158383 RepID=A0A8S0UN31_OLEEU|nr:Hypothetical predicted protein [Olea europaea subsp. europaea]
MIDLRLAPSAGLIWMRRHARRTRQQKKRASRTRSQPRRLALHTMVEANSWELISYLRLSELSARRPPRPTDRPTNRHHHYHFKVTSHMRRDAKPAPGRGARQRGLIHHLPPPRLAGRQITLVPPSGFCLPHNASSQHWKPDRGTLKSQNECPAFVFRRTRSRMRRMPIEWATPRHARRKLD